MRRVKMIGLLLLMSVFFAHAEDSGADLSAKLPKAVAEAWKSAYPTAKLLSVAERGDATQVKASDALNTEFTAEFDSKGVLLQQSPRKIASAELPAKIQSAEKQLAGFEWDPEQIQSSKAPDGKLLYTCRVKANGKLLFVVWTEEGFINEMRPILSPEEQKAADREKTSESPAVTVKVALDQDGRIVFEGKTISDDEYKKLLDDQPKGKKLVIEVHYSTVPDDRLTEFRQLYKNGPYTLKLMRDPGR